MVFIIPNFAKSKLIFATIFTKKFEIVNKNGKLKMRFAKSEIKRTENISENIGITIKLLTIEIGANFAKYLQTNGIVPIVALIVNDIEEFKNFGNFSFPNSFDIGFENINIPTTELKDSKKPTSKK